MTNAALAITVAYRLGCFNSGYYLPGTAGGPPGCSVKEE
jgi:hypothetical protein